MLTALKVKHAKPGSAADRLRAVRAALSLSRPARAGRRADRRRAAGEPAARRLPGSDPLSGAAPAIDRAGAYADRLGGAGARLGGSTPLGQPEPGGIGDAGDVPERVVHRWPAGAAPGCGAGDRAGDHRQCGALAHAFLARSGTNSGPIRASYCDGIQDGLRVHRPGACDRVAASGAVRRRVRRCGVPGASSGQGDDACEPQLCVSSCAVRRQPCS
jgi:hypothetical protein